MQDLENHTEESVTENDSVFPETEDHAPETIAPSGEEETVIDAEPMTDDIPAEAEPEPSAGASAAETEKETSSPAESDENSVSGVGLAMSLCDAVLNAVGRERFHGGIRPDNISVRDRQVFLGSTLKHNVGEFTPQELEYMAPELFWDGIRSPSADVYSLGLVLYSLYNYGRLPFWPSSGAITPNARASALQKRMSDEPIQPPANADAELAAIILRSLAFRTEERWQDIVELRDALGTCDAANNPVDISLAMSGLLTRSTESHSADAQNKQGKSSRTYFDDGDIPAVRKPQRRRNLSWLWVLLLVILAAGALVLLFSDSLGINQPDPPSAATPEPTVAPTRAPTPAPTAEPTPTPEPTKRPSGPKYIVYREDVSWTEAARRCEEQGGILAMPKNEQEFLDITRLCNNQALTYAWLGASRQPNGDWVTPDGEVLTNIYWPWSPGEPSMIDPGDGSAENYMLLWKEGEDEWYFNDSRENPLDDYYWAYGGVIGYVCQMW